MRKGSSLLLFFKLPALGARDWSFLMLAGLGLLLLALLPFWLSSYSLSAMRDALILAIFALSYDFLWGKSFTLTLGHGVFLGLGGYGLAIATTVFGWSPWGGLLVGMAAATVLALVVGYFLLFAGVRLHFFAIITIAVLLIVGQVATSWSSLTGGDVGILGIPGLTLPGLDLTTSVGSYGLAVLALGVVLLGLWAAMRGVYGKVLAAIGTNEFRAMTFGYNTAGHLLTVFVVSAALAGFAGGLFVACTGVVAPDLFSPLLSTQVVLWVAIGGRGTLLGPVAATIILSRLQQVASSYSTDLWPLLLGGLFIAMIVFVPNGLGQVASGLRRRIEVRPS